MQVSSAARCLSAAFLILVFGAGVAWAQATAQIGGTVRDQDGGVLPGATVNVTHVATNVVRTVVTNERGVYGVPNLPLGAYQVDVSLPGFQAYRQTGIVLQANRQALINPVLNLGGLEETVEVVASDAPVELVAGRGISEVRDTEEILALPINDRNVANLVVLSGQAVQTGETAPGSRAIRREPVLYVGGGFRGGTGYSLDGANYENMYDGGPLPFPFPDALEEFSVQTSGLSAEHGSAASVSAVTKAGTNVFHGSLFEFGRFDALNAKPFFAASKSTSKRHQPGGTLGGPISQNRVFFFGGYQGTFLRQDPADRTSRIVTPAMLAGDWTAITSPACNRGRQINLPAPFAGNRIDSARLSAPAVTIARRLLDEAPSPDQCGDVRFGRKDIFDEHQFISRIDYNLNERNALFGRAMILDYEGPAPSTFNNPLLNASGAGASTSAHTYGFGLTSVLSSSAVNSLRVSVIRANIARVAFGAFTPPEVGINAFSPETSNSTIILLSGAFGIGAEFLSTDSIFHTRMYTAENNFNIIRGQHQLNIGGTLTYMSGRRNVGTATSPVMRFDGGVTGLSLGDFMLGEVANMVQGGSPFYEQVQWFPAVYVQDVWRVRPTVTLNFGLRWDPELPIELVEGWLAHFDVDRFTQGVRSTVFPTAPVGLLYPGDPGFPGKSGVHRHLAQFGPRAGVAWDVLGDGRSSLRASYGLTYEMQPLAYYGGQSTASPFFNRLTLNRPQGGLADPWLGVPGGNPFPSDLVANPEWVPFGDYLSMPFDRNNPRASTWNLTFEREFAPGWNGMASYVGSYTTNLWGIKMVNPAVYFFNGTDTCTLPNGRTITGSGDQCSTTRNTNERRRLSLENPEAARFFGRVSEYDPRGKWEYHALRLSLARRAPLGVDVSGNYTLSSCWQHFTSDGIPNTQEAYQNPDDLDAEWGRCTTGARQHIFNLIMSYQTPEFDSAALRALASRWRFSGIYRKASGQFLTIESGQDRALNDTSLQRADQVLDNPYQDRSGDPLTQYLNRDAFRQPALGTFGNTRRGQVEGPGTWQLDMAVARMFPLAGSQNLEFRVEAYNVTNSFRPGGPDTGLTSGNFGLIRSALAPRVLQFGVKYLF